MDRHALDVFWRVGITLGCQYESVALWHPKLPTLSELVNGMANNDLRSHHLPTKRVVGHLLVGAAALWCAGWLLHFLISPAPSPLAPQPDSPRDL